MKIWIHFFKAPKRVLVIYRRHSSLRLKRQMLQIKGALAQEKQETKEMLSIYKKYSMRQATRGEMKIANEQFIDLLKGAGLGVIAILPFAPITLPLVIKLGRKVGVEILPSSFNQPQKPDEVTK